MEDKENDLEKNHQKLLDLTEKNHYLENVLNRDQRRHEQMERELSGIQERTIYLEKLLIQKDSEIEQLKQISRKKNDKNSKFSLMLKKIKKQK